MNGKLPAYNVKDSLGIWAKSVHCFSLYAKTESAIDHDIAVCGSSLIKCSNE